jgi:hypothetical protein
MFLVYFFRSQTKPKSYIEDLPKRSSPLYAFNTTLIAATLLQDASSSKGQALRMPLSVRLTISLRWI